MGHSDLKRLRIGQTILEQPSATVITAAVSTGPVTGILAQCLRMGARNTSDDVDPVLVLGSGEDTDPMLVTLPIRSRCAASLAFGRVGSSPIVCGVYATVCLQERCER